MFIDIADVDESMASAFLPDDMALLAGYWVQIIELSKLLGTVLTVNYQRRRPKPTLTQIEGLERELLHFRLPDLQNPDFSRLAFYFSYHLHLHFQALLITFYRPYGSEKPVIPNGLSSFRQKHWQGQMRLKVNLAASKVGDMAYVLAQDSFIQYAGPMV
ncbi:hypothetical protein TGAMA5MH_09883 [Trichoderma gamsii]|uniref:Uncharacterized protein n=1 Tax=Trichoderma gamsii TaxID=398673 RepID=A0A2K0SY43_9HYPO|nr:hypothetical protein TGAMA5MH_09883 [Trichoderma gamsii]